ncbi:hypothetical protein KCL49_002912 [Clostridium perfringens]|nr:hypothetical protein [Clostridium perfringens]
MNWINKPQNRDQLIDPCYDYGVCNNYNPDNFCLLRFCNSRGSCSSNNCAFYFG